ADHILVEFLFDGARRRDVGKEGFGDAAAAFFLIDDRLAEFDALAADIHIAGPFHERAHVAIALAAEGAISVAVPSRVARGPPPAAGRAGVFGRHAVSSRRSDQERGMNSNDPFTFLSLPQPLRGRGGRRHRRTPGESISGVTTRHGVQPILILAPVRSVSKPIHRPSGVDSYKPGWSARPGFSLCSAAERPCSGVSGSGEAAGTAPAVCE